MGVESVVRRWRERALASDRRAGRWARGKARRAQYAYVRASWRSLALVAAGAMVAPLAMLPFLPNGFSQGLLVGIAITAVAGLLSFWVVQATGTAPTMMGDQGEQWTAQALRKMRRKGWRTVNHVTLRPWDIDHVLVGPGGAYAIETKWSATPWTVRPPERRLLDACRQVRANSRDLTLWLKKLGLGTVEPILVLWGPGARDLAPAQKVIAADGSVIAVVSGPRIKTWMSQLPAGQLTTDQITRAWTALDDQCRLRDPREDLDGPLPLSVEQIAIRGFLAVAAACAAFLTSATWLAQGPSPRWWLPALVVLVVPAIALIRWSRPSRYLAWGWLAGTSVSVLLVAWIACRWALDRLA